MPGRGGDLALAVLQPAFGLTVLGVALVIVASVWVLARPAIAALGWRLVTGSDWNPLEDSFGALPFIYGTVLTSVLALVLAVPVCVGLALYVTELGPGSLRRPIVFLVELLAAVPSVVYGLWALAVLVPLMREKVGPVLASSGLPIFAGPPLGLGYLTASVVLAIMILPTIASLSVDVMRTLPAALREGALALGATRWEAIRLTTLPHARRGILGAIALGLGRALGETMAVTMVIGNQPEIHASLLAAGYTLPAIIANEFAEATGDIHTGALATLALVLFGITVVMNAAARLLVRGRRASRGHG